MKKLISLMMMLLLIFIASACDTQTNNEVVTPAVTETPVITETPEATEYVVTLEPTATETPTTETPIVTEMPSPTPIPTATPVPTPTPIPTPTPVPTPTPSPTPTPDISKFTVMYIKSASVNVRSTPSTQGKKLAALKLNTEVKAYTEVDGWFYVSYGENAFGYIRKDLLSAEIITTPTPVPTPTTTDTAQKPTYKPNSNLDINDNVFLDALEYTGYNLKKHRADGNMWKFILGKDKAGMGYLSGLGYDYGKTSGYETNAQGLPDIERFRKNGGMVCASYATYVYFNYLPNVAKIDTSSIPRPTNSCLAESWRQCAEKWVAMGLSRKITFSATRYSSGVVKFTPSEPIPIGSIVIFKEYNKPDSAPARHVTIYAGKAGGYNWLTHVGNERGPEMITVENMGFGSTPELPMLVITPPISFS